MARGFGRGSLRLAGDGVWVGRWRDTFGREHRVRLSDDRDLAEDRLRAQVYARDAGAVALTELLDRYLDDARGRLRPKSFRSVSDALRRVVAGLRDLSPAAVLEYRAKRLTTPVIYPCWKGRDPAKVPLKHPSHRTVNLEVKALSTMLNWAVGVELIARNPIAKVAPLPERERDLRKRRRPLSDAEIERFLAAVRAMDVGRVVPQEPMWRLLVETGLRWGEATALRPEHLADATITVPADVAKSGTSRAVPIRPELAACLDLPFRMPTGKPWTARKSKNAQMQLEAALRRAGVPYVAAGATVRSVDLHALRTTTATRLALRGVPMPILKKMLGHADPRTTERHYVHVETERIRAAVTAGLKPTPPAPRGDDLANS